MQPRSLVEFTGPSREQGKEINFKFCPVCGSSQWKVYVNPVTGYWMCFAGGHSAGGRIVVSNMTDADRQAALEELREREVLPTVVWPELELPPFVSLGKIARNYLERRGFSLNVCDKLGLVQHRDAPRIVIPYWGPYGQLVGWTARSFSKNTVPKYMGPHGIKAPYMVPQCEIVERAVLVEGPFDAIAVWQATGVPAIALGGLSMSSSMEMYVRWLVTRGVLIMLDSGAEAHALTIRDRLSDRYAPRIVCLPEGDPAEQKGDYLREVVG